MITIKRNYINRLFTSLAGVMCFFLVVLQINSQYVVPEDPSEDVKDPVSIVTGVLSSSSLFGSHHLPCDKKELAVPASSSLDGRTFYDQDVRPVLRFLVLPSLRGPPLS